MCLSQYINKYYIHKKYPFGYINCDIDLSNHAKHSIPNAWQFVAKNSISKRKIAFISCFKIQSFIKYNWSVFVMAPIRMCVCVFIRLWIVMLTKKNTRLTRNIDIYIEFSLVSKSVYIVLYLMQTSSHNARTIECHPIL